MHVPVLLREVVEILDLKPGQFVADGTVGGGGHAKEIVKHIYGGEFLGIDRDSQAIKKIRRDLVSKNVRITLVSGNYANFPQILKRKRMGKADRLLLDLGFSSEQLEKGKGFSFLKPDEPLLMTYDDKAKPLYEVLTELSEEQISSVIKSFSDERYAEKIAEAIYEREKARPVRKVGELVEVVKSAVPKNYEHGRINPATRTFMALRVFTNDEMGNLTKLLERLDGVLKSGGRAAIITFNSNEDRVVKNYFKEMDRAGQGEILTKHVIKPTWNEVKNNPRSRSAKLRAITIN